MKTRILLSLTCLLFFTACEHLQITSKGEGIAFCFKRTSRPKVELTPFYPTVKVKRAKKVARIHNPNGPLVSYFNDDIRFILPGYGTKLVDVETLDGKPVRLTISYVKNGSIKPTLLASTMASLKLTTSSM